MTDKSQNSDPIAWVSGEDPGMRQAIRLAQKSFSQFEAEILLESRRILPALTQCLIKYAFPTKTPSRVKVEHMFLSDIHYNGKDIVGSLASEPVYVDGIQEGDKINVDRARVSDWLYILNGKTHGGFTFQYMWRNYSNKEKKLYRDQPPFSWLDLDAD